MNDQPKDRQWDIELRSISKRFGERQALSDVSLTFANGKVHALLGENGAGKTTLMRILAGETQSDGGAIWVKGRQQDLNDPRKARIAGIRMVHQHLSLIPALTVAENFALLDRSRRIRVDLPALAKSIQEKALSLGITINANCYVWELSLSQRQWIEAIKSLFFGGSTFIFDEPTSLLSPPEADRMLAQLKALAQAGNVVILITHKLREIFGYADAVSVLRRGCLITTFAPEETNPRQLSAMMVGESAFSETTREAPNNKDLHEPVLVANGIEAEDSRGKRVLAGVDVSLYRGRILGIAGVSGNGQTQLAQIIAGIAQPIRGSITYRHERESVIRYIPADRISQGTSADLSVFENLVLRIYRQDPYNRRGVLQYDQLYAYASDLAARHRIQIQTLADTPRVLSGGNVQRIVVAREMAGACDVIVAHNPTSGLDIQTSQFVREQLQRKALNGCAVLLISDDLDELVEMADEILVLHDNRIVGALDRSNATFDRIGAMMAGHGWNDE